MADSSSYSGLQVTLHWLVAVMVASALILSDGMGRLLEQKLDGTLDIEGQPLHVLAGLAVLVLALIRLAVRVASGAPGPVDGLSDAHQKARKWGHVLLYVFLIAGPSGGAIAWFLESESIANVHPIAARVLLILAGGHAAIALWHHYVRKDNTLRRMLRPGTS